MVYKHYSDTHFWKQIDQVPLAKDAGTGGPVMSIEYQK